jgi:hypothetical protein
LLDLSFISLLKAPIKTGINWLKDEGLGLVGLGPLSRYTDFITDDSIDYVIDSVLALVLDDS